MSRRISALGVLVIGLAAPSLAHAQQLMDCKVWSMQGKIPNLREPVPDKTNVFHDLMRGSVEMVCDDTRVFADEIESYSDQDVVHAKGHVLLEQPGMRITADRAEVNRKTHLGTFYNAAGTLQLAAGKADQSLFGALEPDVFFWGDKVEKVGPRTYRTTNGGFTTCVQPTPRWEMSDSESTITVGEHALLKNVVLKVKGVPVFYLPALYYPISRSGRSTGFLMPTYGSSTIRGFTLSNAFFWAINRSQDATFYHDYFAKTGQGMGSEYRYVSSPGSSGNIKFYELNEHGTTQSDGTVSSGLKSYQLNGQLNQELPRGFRLMGRTNYFTSAATQQLYQQNIFDQSNRTRYVGGTLTGGFGRYRLGVNVEQNDTYYGLTSASRIGREPVVNLAAGEKPIGHSKVYFGVQTEVGNFVRQNDLSNDATNISLWRVDLSPTIRAPISTLPFLSVTTSAALRYTYWSESRDPVTGSQLLKPLVREMADLQATITGPSFSKIYQTPNSGYAERYKHLIEPTLRVRWLSPFTKFDNVSQAASDGTDTVVGGLTQIDYGLSNRLLAKRKAPTGPSTIREILSVGISQSYYTDARAASYDQQYQSTITGTSAPSPFSPVQLSASVRPVDPVSGQFQLSFDTKFHAVERYSASANILSPGFRLNAGWSKTEYIPGLAGYDNPDVASHFLNATTSFEGPERHVGGTFSVYYDVRHHTFQQERAVVYYNTQCCGVSVDFQTINLSQFGSSAPRSDRRFGISFTLAGIGSFSNPMGSFGNNSGVR